MSDTQPLSDASSEVPSEVSEQDRPEEVTTALLNSIHLTEGAIGYLQDLLSKQEADDMGIRIFIEKPGTPQAECCMAYCAPSEQEADDLLKPIDAFPVWIDGHSLNYLEDALIDYAKDRMGGQLTFKAPKSKVPSLGPNATIEEQINHLLMSEINPGLASHGGYVSLLELVDEGTTAVLQFGGGCQGCSAVDLTLKQGVEKVLMEQIPQIQKVVDTTDHSIKDNAYY